MGSDLFSCWAFGCAGGLVVPGGVECEVAEDFSGGGVDDSDVVVLDEDHDAGSVVDAAYPYVVQAAVFAQGDRSCFADAVGGDAVVGIDAGLWAGWCRSWLRCPGGAGSGVGGGGYVCWGMRRVAFGARRGWRLWVVTLASV